MVKTITKYQCDICGENYDTVSAARDCEKQGVPDLTKYPIGMMYSHTYRPEENNIIILAVARHSTRCNPHYLDVSNWACRSSRYIGDSLGNDLCGDSGFFNPYTGNALTSEMLACPEAVRLREFLVGIGTEVTYWDGEKCVPYTESEQ